MTTEEAFIKVLQTHGIEHAFGIIGSAMMPVSDLFPKAGITFWDCAHETNAGHHGRRLRARDGQDGDRHGAERAGRHRLRHGDEDRLLEPYAAAAGDAAGRQQDDGAGRLPGSAADGAVPGHRRLPGGGARPLAHGRGAQPRDPEGPARLGAGADQRAARFLDPGDRHRTAGHRAVRAAARAARRRSQRRRSCCRRRSFRSSLKARAWCWAGAIPQTRQARGTARCAGLLGLSAQRFVSRLAPPRRRSARLQRLEGGDGVDRQGRRRARAGHAAQSVLDACRAMGSTIGPSMRRSSRSTSTPTGSV